MKTIERIRKSRKQWGNLRSSSMGTEHYYVLTPMLKDRLVITDGVKEIFDRHECWWVGDIVASYFPKLKGKEIVTAYISKDLEGNGALFTMDEGNNEEDEIFVKQEIPYTDIEKNLMLFIQLYDHGKYCIMMPEEY
jgi:hypothetical protein